MQIKAGWSTTISYSHEYVNQLS